MPPGRLLLTPQSEEKEGTPRCCSSHQEDGREEVYHQVGFFSPRGQRRRRVPRGGVLPSSLTSLLHKKWSWWKRCKECAKKMLGKRKENKMENGEYGKMVFSHPDDREKSWRSKRGL